MTNYLSWTGLVVLLLGLSACKTLTTNPAKLSTNQNKANVPTVLEIETRFGNMELELFDNTPKHRDNFLKLVKEAYYDDLLFHRVIKNFMIQGGDPNSKNATKGSMLGTGGPGYTVPAEFVTDNVHIKGALAAARQGDNVNPTKASSGSQFYLAQGAPVAESLLDQIEAARGFKYTPEQREAYKTIGGTPHLDREYTVFGRVTKGLDIIDSIAAQPTDRSNRPLEDIKMKIRLKPAS